MRVQGFLLTVDRISAWSGKVFAWLIVILALVVGVEVFKRYILNAPTSWIFDLNSMLYGTLFMMCGAYALAQNAHVRGDFLYGSMKPRTQAALDLVALHPLFHPRHPGAGLRRLRLRQLSWASTNTRTSPPTARPLSVQDDDPDGRRPRDDPGSRRDHALRRVPAHGRMAGAPQGCRRDRRGRQQLSHSELVDEESRRRAIAQAHDINEAARQRGMGDSGHVENVARPGDRK